ncbi:general transcription factor 3C polypeptide 3 (transcription factor C subunit 4) [Cryptococcus gattii E566]|nr:general transcription factor 3C polypeptide 3 (transcription factor C subunit 4) [Cryptococcus gattii E566]
MSADFALDPALLDEDGTTVYTPLQDRGSSDSDDLYGESDDEYQDSQPDDVEEPDNDVVFGRLAGLASKTAPGKGKINNAEFQRELELADEEELPASRRSGKTLQKQPRRAHKPSHEVNYLLGQANGAYLVEDYDKAISSFLEVIRLDPYVPAAWVTLSSCYKELGDEEKARQMRFLGAHVDDEGDLWRELAQEFKEIGHLEQSVYCLRKALKCEPDQIDLLWDLGAIYRIQGQKTRGCNVFRAMLQIEPELANNLEFTSTFHPLLVSMNLRGLAAQTARRGFDYQITTYPSPSQRPRVPDASPPMTYENIITLIDDLLALEEYEDALVVVKQGQRWLQGRAEQKGWDTMDDDREYDPPGTIREEVESEGFEMDVGMRHRLALSRIKLDDIHEANIHINFLLSLDVLTHYTYLQELGDALMTRDRWERALDCFAAVQECEELPDDPPLIYKIGVCQWKMGDLEEALEALQWVASEVPDNLEAKLRIANVLEDMGRKAEALDIVTEVIRTRGERGTLSSTIQMQPGVRISKRMLEEQLRSQMQNLWADVQDAERGTMEGEEGALERFVESAGLLIENYRMDRSNFTKNRGMVRVLKSKKYKKTDVDDQAAEMQDRLERTLGLEEIDDDNPYHVFRKTSFYGLSNEEWLTLVVKYCCVLMVRGEEEVAMDILEHVVWSGLFHNRRCEIALRLTIIACAMRLKAYDKIIDSARKLALRSQFLPQPFLIMLAAISTGGSAARAVFTDTSLQNFINRDIRAYDEAVRNGDKGLHYLEGKGRWSANKGKTKGESKGGDGKKRNGKKAKGRKKVDLPIDPDLDEEEEAEDRVYGVEGEIGWGYKPVLPKKFSPYLNVILGQEMLASKAFKGAIFYLTRAYELDPWNPFICLLIAQAYLGRAMTRQSDNKNYQIAQGMVFLSQYRKLSPNSGPGMEDVEYNFGRAFHSIGVPHFAVKHYEKVLDSVQQRMDESMFPEEVRKSSLAWEAAHNLMLLYSMAENMALVKEKSKWLAI